jgi:hypothetical protein
MTAGLEQAALALTARMRELEEAQMAAASVRLHAMEAYHSALLGYHAAVLAAMPELVADAAVKMARRV